MRPHRCGVHRALVIDNEDPDVLGRIRVQCSLFGAGISKWIQGCILPGATSLPPIGSQVWLSFELGDDDYPVWIGQVTGPWFAGSQGGLSGSASSVSGAQAAALDSSAESGAVTATSTVAGRPT